MIAVMGATGHTGRAAALRLLEAGVAVRALGRNRERLQDLVDRGAEARIGEATDSRYLTRAFKGADGVYTMIPPNHQAPDYLAFADRVGRATAKAIQQAGVRHVVFLSSIGADRDDVGVLRALHRQERRLWQLRGVRVLALRAGYFFENYVYELPAIAQTGVFAGSLRGDLALSQCSARDIGRYAGELLARLAFRRKTHRELHGPQPLSLAAATEILARKLGVERLKYVELPYEVAIDAMVKAGLTRDLATLYNELSEAFNEGRAKELDGPERGVKLGMDFEVYADELALMYRALSITPTTGGRPGRS